MSPWKCSSAMNIQQDTSSNLDQQTIRWNSRRRTSLSSQWTNEILLRETHFSLASLSNSSTPMSISLSLSIDRSDTSMEIGDIPEELGHSSPLEANHFLCHYATKMRRVQLNNRSSPFDIRCWCLRFQIFPSSADLFVWTRWRRNDEH